MRHPLQFDKPHRKERRHRRFDLQFPVSLNFSSDGAIRELAGFSRNISIGGLLLKVDDPVRVRTQVSLTMAVHDPRLRRPVQLLAEGTVVRVERLESAAGFAIAIECKRPITEIEDHLPPSAEAGLS
jgi:PilZ domain-containing protein